MDRSRSGGLRAAARLLCALMLAGGVAAAEGSGSSASAAASERRSLFADYRTALRDLREETGYQTFVAAKGEGLEALLARADIPRGARREVLDALASVRVDTAPEAGAVDIAFGPDGAPARLRLFPAPGEVATAWRDAEDGPWRAERRRADVTVAHVAAGAVMTDSLFGAGARAGIPREVMARLANLFLYDVDFVRDIRVGDRFEVVYEARFDAQGRPLGTGDIVFAAMTWRGGEHAKGYYRYEDEASEARYFDVGGASAQRLLMKTPIEGARVTSRFGRRRHPTLGYTKAHKGVDFGARSGTPIMAAGDGTVVRAGPLGSYGNFLLIRHANGYETAYAHLRGFADGVRKGARVRQGEVVAYVGSTGRSTGPHLHYEVRAEGRHVNPMTLDVATGAVLDGEALAAFGEARRAADAMRALPLAVPGTEEREGSGD